MIHKNWQELIRPTGLDIRPGADPSRMATVVAEPSAAGPIAFRLTDPVSGESVTASDFFKIP